MRKKYTRTLSFKGLLLQEGCIILIKSFNFIYSINEYQFELLILIVIYKIRMYDLLVLVL